ncbi:hypothetical protein LTR36_009806 [Oleoguttula mirabilis]|uniref:Uncharacterized protein n=1 Tax=Oleoguttula mirabilis TaxID=1507867 RepID=A0AAV9J509_9PEZI|nr:hypothetical protein LTR36_009806 [Oleoguttula mirabilis]
MPHLLARRQGGGGGGGGPHVPRLPRLPHVSKEKIKEAPRKAYWQTREAFRNSVSSLRRDSVDAPSLFAATDESVGSSMGTLSPAASPGASERAEEEQREGKGRRSLESLKRKLSLRSGVR